LQIDKCITTYFYQIQVDAVSARRDARESHKNTAQKREYFTLFEAATVSTVTHGFVSKRNI
jgi:hypothetical protein